MSTASDWPDFDADWDYSDPVGTEERFRSLLEEHTDAPAAWRLELKTQIARAQGLQADFEAAHDVLDNVEARLGDRAVTRVRYLLERGRVFNSAGAPEKARPLFEQAWELARQAGDDQLAVDAAHMVALAVEETDEELAWNEKALELAENSRNAQARKWLGSLYNNIGWTYHGQERFEEALETFRKGLEWRREYAAEDRRGLRVARWTVGVGLRSLGRNEAALATQRAIAADFEDEDPYNQEELGWCLTALDREEEAREHFQRAYEGLKDDAWVKENQPEKIEKLKAMAEGN